MEPAVAAKKDPGLWGRRGQLANAEVFKGLTAYEFICKT